MRARLRQVVTLFVALMVGLGVYFAWSALTAPPPGPPPPGSPPPGWRPPEPLAVVPRPTSSPTSVEVADAGRALRLRFVTAGTPVADLRFRADAMCGDSLVAQSQFFVTVDARTDAEGVGVVPGVGADCTVWLTARDPSLSLLREQGSDTVEVVPGRPVHLLVTDAAQRPIAQAQFRGGAQMPSCTTDSEGRCELSWPVQQPDGLLRSWPHVTAPGYAEKVVQQELEREVHVVLEPDRRVFVTVEAPGSSLLAPLTLVVEDEVQQVASRRTLDAPGRYEMRGLPSGVPLKASLSEPGARPVVRGTVAAGTSPGEVSLAVTPRRLVVWVDSPEESGPFHFAHQVDVRCAGSPRLLVDSRPSGDGRMEVARLEYAPPGPCEVTRAESDSGWATDPNYETVTVSPPGEVTVHRRG